MSVTCDADCTEVTCGDGVLNHVAGEECDQGDVTPGDGCSATCQLETPSYPPPAFKGYAGFGQSCSQPDAAQDAAMDQVCAAAFAGSRAATTAEVVLDHVSGLPATNGAGGLVMFKCPFCEGNPAGCASGFARKCHGGGAWPDNLYSGWNLNCQSSSRKAMCVQD